MANKEYVEILKSGISNWNEWRIKNPDIRPDLSGLSFYDIFDKSNDIYYIPSLDNANFDRCNLRNAQMRDCEFINCTFIDAELHMSDCCYAYFYECKFINTRMRLSRIGSTTYNNCILNNCDLSYSSAEETEFDECIIEGTKFQNVSFVKTHFSGSRIARCNVYGISSWDLDLSNSTQEDIYIMEDEEDLLSVGDIELAQFLYMMIENRKLRRIIDTVTSKVVLILGRFTPKRKMILDKVKVLVRNKGLIPILFDFDGPDSRDVTETVKVLANMSKFVIADLTDAKSIPQELSIIIPTTPSLQVYPIILESEREYCMYSFFEKYPWVMEMKKYNEENIDNIVLEILHAQ